ncbi:MAG: carbonic anhydrase family protein [Lamprobacter sp.]|uniref:carbonic anhydrase n=1 Tax=Lamprobacter sp. TaxID=3100796 RepID=UPI002B25DE3C|nr:carbonic anhydrase family protein [Lamprobacter sp.]MEA3641051.1 carbonic anhydrase family protein [Lamprobacter sp.]
MALYRLGRGFPLAPMVAGAALLLLAAKAHAWQARISDMTAAVPDWSYSGERGPSHWADLNASYAGCASGLLQSPIPIETAATFFQPCTPLRFRYRSSSLHLVNDGNALRLGYDRGSFLVIDGLSYELVELRFHVPGEHAIDGRIWDGEIEFIHGNNRGDLLIVSVLIEAGNRANQTLRRILDNAPLLAGKNAHGRNIGVNAVFLLPTRRSYFRYDGSTTRPPCEEGVRRYVMESPLEIAASDLARLAQVTSSNARPLQPLGARRIERFCTANAD